MIDYWKYPAVVDTFFRATKNTEVTCVGGGRIRVRGGQAVLVRPPDTDDDWKVERWNLPPQTRRIRSLNYLYVPTVVRMRASVGWFADRSFVASKTSRYGQRRGKREGIHRIEPTRRDLVDLVDRWADWAKDRHFMVVRGHYCEMAADDRFNFFGYELGGELVGAIGWTCLDGEAAITFAKHVKLHPGGNLALWADTLEVILQNYHTVNCGDTADELKRELGLRSVPLFRMRPIMFCAGESFRQPPLTGL